MSSPVPPDPSLFACSCGEPLGSMIHEVLNAGDEWHLPRLWCRRCGSLFSTAGSWTMPDGPIAMARAMLTASEADARRAALELLRELARCEHAAAVAAGHSWCVSCGARKFGQHSWVKTSAAAAVAFLLDETERMFGSGDFVRIRLERVDLSAPADAGAKKSTGGAKIVKPKDSN